MPEALPNPFYLPNDPLDPESRQLANRRFIREHEETTEGLNRLTKLTGRSERFTHPKLKTAIGNVELDNPLMVAAGWDKFGESVKGLYELGFGAVEVGSVQRDPQPGNPKDRHFILAPGVMINRYGFNTPGAAAVKNNLQRYSRSGVPLGINIGKNKEVSIDDAPQAHADVAELLYHEATYFALGVSSPNTVGLSDQQSKGVLLKIAEAVQVAIEKKGGGKAVFVKIGSDLSEQRLDDIVTVVSETGLAGVIAANTTTDKTIKAKYGEQWRDEPGGLSGDDDDYRALSNKIIAYLYQQTNGKMPIIGAGGVVDTATALEKIRAGASAVQMVSAINFRGPSLAGDINQGLIEYMDSEGVSHISDLVGAQS